MITKTSEKGRFYRLPNDQDLAAIERAKVELEKRKEEHQGELSLVPDEPTPLGGGSGAGRAFSQRNYGMDKFENLFTARQSLALTTLVRLVQEVGEKLAIEKDQGLAIAVQSCLSLSVSKITDIFNSLCSWQPISTRIGHLFTRQTLPIVWDFPENSPVSNAAGDYAVTLKNFLEVLDRESLSNLSIGNIDRFSSVNHVLPDMSVQGFISDPPYYDAVPYSDLSDFFYVWLKRLVPSSLREKFEEELTPKNEECIVDETKGKDKSYFEHQMGLAMAESCRILEPDGIGLIVFAHKSTAGWEAQLQAMIDARWTIRV